MTSDDHLSIYVRRWYPETHTIGDFEEVVLFKDTTVKSLKQKVYFLGIFF